MTKSFLRQLERIEQEKGNVEDNETYVFDQDGKVLRVKDHQHAKDARKICDGVNERKLF